jgi:hypothetical protein
MKTKTLLSIPFLFMAVLTLAGSSATNPQVATEEEFYKHWVGTWINTDNPIDPYRPQKIVCHANGTIDIHGAPNVPKSYTHIITLIESWKDSEGNIWYRGTHKSESGTTFSEYGKISTLNNTYELIRTYTDNGDAPIKEWDPDNPEYMYLIYYRQE